jgi:hypothetical protein
MPPECGGVNEKKGRQHVGFTLPPISRRCKDIPPMIGGANERKRGGVNTTAPVRNGKKNRGQHMGFTLPPFKTERNGGRHIHTAPVRNENKRGAAYSRRPCSKRKETGAACVIHTPPFE